MNLVKGIFLWLALAFGSFFSASALTPTALENRIWEIFNIGYDAPTTEATDLGNRTETSTSSYDTAPIHRAITEEMPTEANRPLFGPNAEFKAAEETAPAINSLIRTDSMSARDFSDLVSSIDKNGLQNPVINYVKIGDDPFVVLGSNRLKAARMLNITDQLQLKAVQLPFRGYQTEQDVIDAAIENGWHY